MATVAPKKEPNTSQEWYNYGREKLNFWKQYRKLSDLEEAIRAFKKALKLDPKNENAKNKLKEASQEWYTYGLEKLNFWDKYGKPSDLEEAIRAFDNALKLDPKNENAKNKLKEANELLARIEPKLLRLRGMEAYVKEDYKTAILYWEELIKKYPNSQEAQDITRDSDLAKAYHHLAKIYYSKGNYEKAIECCEKAYDLYLKSELHKNLAEKVMRLQDEALAKLYNEEGGIPPSLLPVIIAAIFPNWENRVKGQPTGAKSGEKKEESKKPSKVASASVGEKKEPTLFASVGEYTIYVDNKNIDRKTGVGKTNLDPYAIKDQFEKGEKTDWAEIIKGKCKGTYIGALVDERDKTAGVFYIANGEVYLLTWEIGGLSGEYVLHNGQRLSFKTTKINGNGEYGIYVKKKEEAPALTKLKKDFEEVGFV